MNQFRTKEDFQPDAIISRKRAPSTLLSGRWRIGGRLLGGEKRVAQVGVFRKDGLTDAENFGVVQPGGTRL